MVQKKNQSSAHSAENFMQLALQQAQLAVQKGEVPIGAVLIYQGEVIAADHNRTLELQDPSAHAEMLVLRQGAKLLGNHRLNECSLFVTLEPCAMCSGAVFQARLKHVVYGAKEVKTGCAGSVLDLFSNKLLNHHTQVKAGLLAKDSARLLRDFFQTRRLQRKQARAMLREDALRSPESCFCHAPAAGYFTSSLQSLQGLRLHYQKYFSQKSGLHSQVPTIMLLHPPWHWSAIWNDILQNLQEVMPYQDWLAPDLIGWGRSDKPKKSIWHSWQKQAYILSELLETIGQPNVVLIAWQGLGAQLVHELGLLLGDRLQKVIWLKNGRPTNFKNVALSPVGNKQSRCSPKRSCCSDAYSQEDLIEQENLQQGKQQTETIKLSLNSSQISKMLSALRVEYAEQFSSLTKQQIELALTPYPDKGHAQALGAHSLFQVLSSPQELCWSQGQNEESLLCQQHQLIIPSSLCFASLQEFLLKNFQQKKRTNRVG